MKLKLKELIKNFRKIPKVSVVTMIVVMIGYIVIKNRKEGLRGCLTKTRSGNGNWSETRRNCKCGEKPLVKIASKKNIFGRIISTDYGCMTDDEYGPKKLDAQYAGWNNWINDDFWKTQSTLNKDKVKKNKNYIIHRTNKDPQCNIENAKHCFSTISDKCSENRESYPYGVDCKKITDSEDCIYMRKWNRDYPHLVPKKFVDHYCA